VLVTCHRRESIPEGIDAIAHAVRVLARRNPDVRFQFVLHPSPAVQRAVLDQLSGAGMENIDLLPACDYVSFVRMLSEAYLILTDSGGVQEEATALGTPLLVVNPRTARQEGLTVGTAAVVGTDSIDIADAAQRLLDDPALRAGMATPHDAYGDGKAGERIAAILAATLRGGHRRETGPELRIGPLVQPRIPPEREATDDSDGVLV
jgi:UDP-N-acetylglucosamine 2-epimerase (non-hydrolysing)